MAQSSRPRVDLDRTGFETALEALGLVGLVVLLAVTAASWPDLPARIPTHFGAGGEPDGWGSRWTVLLMPAIGLVMYAGLAVLSRYPHIYNYPVRITPANAESQYRLARGLLLWMRVEMGWLFAGLQWGTVRVALGRAEGLGTWVAVFWLVVILGTVGVYVVRSLRAR